MMFFKLKEINKELTTKKTLHPSTVMAEEMEGFYMKEFSEWDDLKKFVSKDNIRTL